MKTSRLAALGISALLGAAGCGGMDGTAHDEATADLGRGLDALRSANAEHRRAVGAATDLAGMMGSERDHPAGMRGSMDSMMGSDVAGCGMMEGGDLHGALDDLAAELDSHRSRMMDAGGMEPARAEEERHQGRMDAFLGTLDGYRMHRMMGGPGC